MSDPLVDMLLKENEIASDPLVKKLLSEQQTYEQSLPSRTARVEEDIAGRQDMWQDLGIDKTAELGPTGAPLAMVGGLGQRIVAGVSNPLIALAQGRGKNAIEEIGQGLTGERLGNVGDIGRQLGVPDPLSAIGGLVGEGFLDPISGATGAARIAAMRGTAKIGGMLSRKGLSVMASKIHDLPDKMKEDIIADKGRAFSKNFFEQGALPRAIKKITDNITQEFYNPAQEEWKKLAESSAQEVVDPLYVQKLADDLEQKFADAIKTSRDDGILASTIQRLRSLIKPPEPKAGIILPPRTSASPQTVYLKDLIEAKADLRKYAPNSKVAMEAATDISKKLAKDFESVDKANTSWQNYRLAEEALERGGVKVDQYLGQEVATAAQGKLLNYYRDPFTTSRTAFLGSDADPRPSLVDIYNKAKKDPQKFLSAFDDVKRVLQARELSSRAPIGSQVAGRGIALPIGLTLSGMAGGGAAGSALGPFGMGAGALIGGAAAMAASTPRAFSGMWRRALTETNPRGTFIQEFMKRKIHERAIDVGTGRLLTGRTGSDE